jgi:hypothetical protein
VHRRHEPASEQNQTPPCSFVMRNTRFQQNRGDARNRHVPHNRDNRHNRRAHPVHRFTAIRPESLLPGDGNRARQV